MSVSSGVCLRSTTEKTLWSHFGIKVRPVRPQEGDYAVSGIYTCSRMVACMVPPLHLDWISTISAHFCIYIAFVPTGLYQAH
jgi:hypothetical protein